MIRARPMPEQSVQKSAAMQPARMRSRIHRDRSRVILNAALDAFSRHGYRGTSINLIAQNAGMSTPALLYYFKSKEDLHSALVEQILMVWIAPLNMVHDSDDPVEEVCTYVRRKLESSRKFPRESRLFANEILMGMPRMRAPVFAPLATVFDTKIALVEEWVEHGRIAPVDAHHLLYSIWATTQHYADFSSQIMTLSPHKVPSLYEDAEIYLTRLYRRMLTPGPDPARPGGQGGNDMALTKDINQ